MAGNDGAAPMSGNDAFWLTDLYPDAAALFQHQQASLGEISEKCVVALDANVLLWPFELGAASVEDIAKLYKKLAGEGRLIVPAQAAREFYKHRSRKVAALTEAIDGVIQKAKRAPLENAIPLLSNDADYQAAQELNAQIVNAGKEMAKRLLAASERLKEQIGSDRISLIYRNALSDCVVDIPQGPEERKAIIDEAGRRARLQIAPGYKDQNKEDGGLGDLIIWMTILQEGAARKADCIFVTNEEKSDWWVKSRGAFQPRPELIEEYRRQSKGRSIHFLPLSGLLAHFKASQETVDEVQKLEEVSRSERQGATIIRLRNIIAERMQKKRDLTAKLQHLDAEIELLRNRINSEDPAALSPQEWGMLSSMEAERSAVADKLKEIEEIQKNMWSSKLTDDELRKSLLGHPKLF